MGTRRMELITRTQMPCAVVEAESGASVPLLLDNAFVFFVDTVLMVGRIGVQHNQEQ